MGLISRVERSLHNCPKVDCSDYETFPPVSEEAFVAMQRTFLEDESLVYIFPLVSKNADEVVYIDIYVFDLMLLPFGGFRRFIICNGYRLPEHLENDFLRYVHGYFSPPDEDQMKSFNIRVLRAFPEWHYFFYSYDHLRDALLHAYYASHNSGVREILYKAGLPNIALHVEKIPSINVLGTSPETILGPDMPLKLIRILNRREFLDDLFHPEAREVCKKAYKLYGGYIGKEAPTYEQFRYLIELCKKGGLFYGRTFDRTIYIKLSESMPDYCLRSYSEFLCLREQIPEMKKAKTPEWFEVDEVVDYLRKILYYISIRNEKSDYEYEGEHYCVLLPKSAADMCIEALGQRNCLVDYIGKHASGRTTILFLREKKAKDKPFVTIEVKENEIEEVRGRFNSFPAKDVYIFLEEYARAKLLIYNPYNLISAGLEETDIIERRDGLWEYAKKFKNLESRLFVKNGEPMFQMAFEEAFPEQVIHNHLLADYIFKMYEEDNHE